MNGKGTITPKLSYKVEITEKDGYKVGELVPTPLVENVEIGDYVDYNPISGKSYKIYKQYSGMSSDQTINSVDMSWRVLSKNEQTGEVKLIANTVTSPIAFKSVSGYNNAVYLLNNMCDTLYGKPGVGIGRSINIEDINEYSTFNPQTDRTTINNGYGKTTRPSRNTYCPALWKYEIGCDGATSGISASADGSSKMTMPTIQGYTTGYTTATDNDYTYKPNTYITGMPYQLMFGFNNSYFIASRCIDVGAVVSFKIRICEYSSSTGFNIISNPLCTSLGTEGDYWSRAVLPVISLTPNILTAGKSASGEWELIEPEEPLVSNVQSMMYTAPETENKADNNITINETNMQALTITNTTSGTPVNSNTIQEDSVEMQQQNQIIYVAQINDEKYETLTQAIENIPKDESKTTIKVLEDCSTQTLTVSEKQNVVLDLNGKKITSSEKAIINYGTLTILDNKSGGMIKSTSENFENISNAGTINIGINDGNVDISKPIISGGNYGIINISETAVINFYDGKIIGKTAWWNEKGILNCEVKYIISKVTNSDDFEEATLGIEE